MLQRQQQEVQEQEPVEEQLEGGGGGGGSDSDGDEAETLLVVASGEGILYHYRLDNLPDAGGGAAGTGGLGAEPPLRCTLAGEWRMARPDVMT